MLPDIKGNNIKFVDVTSAKCIYSSREKRLIYIDWSRYSPPFILRNLYIYFIIIWKFKFENCIFYLSSNVTGYFINVFNRQINAHLKRINEGQGSDEKGCSMWLRRRNDTPLPIHNID